MRYFQMIRTAALVIFLRGAFGIALCSLFASLLAAQPLPLSIVDEPLPPIEVGVEFHIFLQATGGAPPYLWRVESGDLPEGMSLSPQGLLSGSSAKAGAFSVTLQVQDSNRPPHSINKVIKGTVVSSLLLEWQQPPKVNDNRIDGSLQVSNSSTESFDLTVIIVAIAQDGRATAIGYQHFPLKPGSKNIQIPFGNTLPYGSYVVHADAIAEIPKRNSILRRRLQTPTALAVLQGP
jgi:hypothetical protein